MSRNSPRVYYIGTHDVKCLKSYIYVTTYESLYSAMFLIVTYTPEDWIEPGSQPTDQ
jgi:hypothetical protein